MDSKLLNMSKVESFFYDLLYNKLSKNIFFTSLPSTIKREWREMVLVDVNINDNNVGKGIVNIFLYSKPMADSRKNVGDLNIMENKLVELAERSNDEHYHITKYNTYSDYDASRKLYYNVVSFGINII